MLKLIGAMIIFISAWSAGVYFVKQNNIRIKQLELTITFYEKLTQDLKNNANNLSESIKNTCYKVDFMHKKALLDFANQLEKPDVNTFIKAWENCKNKEKYDISTINIMDSFAENIETSGIDFCVDAIDKITEKSKSLLKENKLKIKNDNKLIINVCICFGILIVITLI